MGRSLSTELTVASAKGMCRQTRTGRRCADRSDPVDLIFSPIRQVGKVENERVGQITDYDRLLLTIETDGLLHRRCGCLCARILQDQLQPFINFDELEGRQGIFTIRSRSTAICCVKLTSGIVSAFCNRPEERQYCVYDLVQKTESEMLRTEFLANHRTRLKKC